MNVFVVREIKDAFETVKDLEKIGVKSQSLPITKCNYKTIPNYKIKYDFILLTSAKSITIFIRFINFYKKIHNKIDDLVDKVYANKIFESDQDRLSFLFKMYANKNQNNELF